MNAYLILGCNGHTDAEGFIYCESTSNAIVDISSIGHENRGRVTSFLDKAGGLFDSPCYDYNKCINIINLLYRQFSTIDEETLHKIQGFMRMHRVCGLFIMLILKEDYVCQK